MLPICAITQACRLEPVAPGNFRTGRRRAFTLIELLVVTGLLLVLMGMALVMVPAINNEQQATQAGTQLQQWIEIAKQRAGRDRVPRGIRLMPGTANSLQVTQLQYIEQPPDFWLGSGSSFFTNGQNTLGWVVTFTLTPPMVPPGTVTPNLVSNFTGNSGNPAMYSPKNPAGGADPNAGRYPVQPGDRLVMGVHNETHTIAAVSDKLELTLATQPSVFPAVPPVPWGVVKQVTVQKNVVTVTWMPHAPTAGPAPVFGNGQSVVIAGLKQTPKLNGVWTIITVAPGSITFALPFNMADTLQAETGAISPLNATTPYKIMRQPRPIGDDPLQMPVNIIIDLQARGINGGIYDLPPPPIDIMFAPDGRVIGPMAAYDKIILWVRDVTVQGAPGDPAPAQGDPSLVCIYPRTGLVQAHPVDVSFSNSSPYTFTTTGRRSTR